MVVHLIRRKEAIMVSLQERLEEYKRQLGRGVIQVAYKGLMQYINYLRRYLNSKYPEYAVSGDIYQGFMDMTYFSFTPPLIKAHNLKIAIVFAHEPFRFDVGLAARNKAIQEQYWKLFKNSDWRKYPVVPTLEGRDTFIDHILGNNPDFSDLNKLTTTIELGTLKFINEIEVFLSSNH